ncbi:alpha/beta fold hydrolase [Litorihabitans aurantiacus]|uniref:Alpha/beta hydrolase n=1 Tax=Litorihabitans aurantiacus TaxID=1930061 RepID=A0AA38CRR1_9MICO|nr:alpha/beta fold hydrolase [Litorihabitans aurantiacus]GMA33008.1 alpha/beta hydrolase [Litorihabitans aurantiacus]
MSPTRPSRLARTPRTPAVRTAALLAASALALTLAACSPTASGDGDAAPSSSSGSPDDAGLAAFEGQTLDFGPCEDYAVTELDREVFGQVDRAECARLEVPVDYDSPDGEVAQIAVLRLPATGESLGPLVVNPGGPGGPGLIQAINAAAGLVETTVPERFDIVGFDPRGVGASLPAVDCASDAEADAGGNVLPQAASSRTWTAADVEAATERCVEGTGSEALLANLGTRDAARDLDLLRSALGQEQISWLGQSYGARLGTVYAEMFPERVRALVLDSGPDPSAGTIERRTTQYAGFQAAFDAMAQACASAGDCVLGDDPALAVQRFQEIVRPLLDTPVPTADGRALDYDAAINGVIAGLYDAATWPVVLEGLAQVAQGGGDVLLAQGETFGGRGSDGVWSNYLEANSAINCMDEERRTPEQEEELRAEIHAVAPFMDPGRGPEGARDGCEAWPAEPDLGYPHAEGVEGLPTTLTIAITGDPSTPYDGGVALARTLGSALLTVEGAQHTVAMSGVSPCVSDVVTAYLLDPAAPLEDGTCAL